MAGKREKPEGCDQPHVSGPVWVLVHDWPSVHRDDGFRGRRAVAQGTVGAVRRIRTRLRLLANTGTYAEQSSRHSARAAARFSLKFWRE